MISFRATSVLFALAAMGLPATAHAQQQACVQLLVGAGYTAKMRITWGNSETGWSGTFPIGKSACQPLGGNVPAGSTYNVEVHANAGKTKTCTPSGLTYNPLIPTNVVYNANGTTLNVKCSEPN